MASATTGEFFDALWGGVEGIAEIRCIGGDRPRQFFFRWPADREHLVAKTQEISGQTNVYFGVCLRSRQGGEAADVAHATAVWVDLDFKQTPEAQVIANLKGFRLRPSIGLVSGGGHHVYWLLKEAVEGPEDFKRLVAVNRALAKVLGADMKACDIARILRVPSTLNIKYKPPRPCQVIVFRPDTRYTLDDFEAILTMDDQQKAAHQPLGHAPPGGYPMPEDLQKKLAPLIQGMWKEGSRHAAALFLSGMLAKAGITYDSVKKLIESVCYLTGDPEIDDRLRAVDESYKKLAQNPGEVGGSLRLEKDVINQLPQDIRWQAQRALGIIDRTVKELQSESTDLLITRIEKFDTRPAKWGVSIRTGNAEYLTTVDTETLSSLTRFRQMFLEEHTFIPPEVTLKRWEKMINDAPKDIIHVESEEATEIGYLKQTILDFEGRARPEAMADVALRAVPVRLDTGEIVIRLQTLLRFLKNEGIDLRKRTDVLSVLRSLGYKPAQRRFGKGPIRGWIRSADPKHDSNGENHEAQ